MRLLSDKINNNDIDYIHNNQLGIVFFNIGNIRLHTVELVNIVVVIFISLSDLHYFYSILATIVSSLLYDFCGVHLTIKSINCLILYSRLIMIVHVLFMIIVYVCSDFLRYL